MKIINEKIKEYLLKKKEMEILKTNLDEIKSNIKMLMESENLTYYEDEEGNDVKIREQQRKTLNKKLVQEKLSEDVFNECFKISEFTMVDIRSKARREQQKYMVNKTGIETLKND